MAISGSGKNDIFWRNKKLPQTADFYSAICGNPFLENVQQSIRQGTVGLYT